MVMRISVENIYLNKDAVTQWSMQAGNINTNLKVEVDLNLPELSAMNAMTWKCCVYDPTKGRYHMIL